MRGVFLLFWLFLVFPVQGATTSKGEFSVQVYHNRILDKDSVIRMSGIDQDQTLSATEVKRRLQSTSMFSSIYVNRDAKHMSIFVEEKANWFIVPYFSAGSNSKTLGLAAGKSSLWGQDGNIIARAQIGTKDHEADLLIRNEFFRNSLFILGGSLDYENSQHSIYSGRNVVSDFSNRYHGGSFQTGYHFATNLVLGFNTYLEQHHFSDLSNTEQFGLQFSHRIIVDLGTLSLNEGLTRGLISRFYFETSNPASDFQFQKMGVLIQCSPYLKGDFNWISRPRFEIGKSLPFYQRFELGEAKLRSFPSQQFRDNSYLAIQNDLLLFSMTISSLRVRPLVYLDWAEIQNHSHTGIGTGFQVYLRDVVFPAVQVFAGYGFDPDGFALSASLGPKF